MKKRNTMRPKDMDWEMLCEFIRHELRKMTIKEFRARYSDPVTWELVDRPLDADRPCPASVFPGQQAPAIGQEEKNDQTKQD